MEEKNERRNSCTACTFQKNGVKTRRAIPHTCGKDDKKSVKKRALNLQENMVKF